MGLGGHSYGAFSTVNALTLVPYFKAGIAGDGMYNRSLTPFGFQSERRDFFTGAGHVSRHVAVLPRRQDLRGALLMYHSLEDQNVGTAPISSDAHVPRAAGTRASRPRCTCIRTRTTASPRTQTDLDQWARWFAWFDVYVKNPKKDTKAVQP